MFLIMLYHHPIIFKNILWALFTLVSSLSLYLTFSFKTIILSWTIISSSAIQIQIPLILDPMGTIFSSTVLFISANIIHFTISYIKNDPFIQRFSILIIIFISSINFLIFIPHIIALLLGWDGLGITSFILVIYYQNPKSLAAGIITALRNRIGDAAILIRIGWTLNQGQWSIIHTLSTPINHIIIPVIILAAITKRAQIPFSSWLPAAIAAPTPVSALVHSSTLVTAGVFLLLRFYPSIETIPNSKTILLIVATSTIFIAGMSALFECDIKKIIALSTLRQLGVIIGAISLSLPHLRFFHLITHAIFKALLFIGAGNLISSFHHRQDLRAIGCLSKQLPLTISITLLSIIALCGSPFLAGFYSKDIILEITLYSPTNAIIMLMFIVATIITAAYSTRILLILVWAPPLSSPLLSINDEETNITTPILKITSIAITVGALINWIIFSPFNEPLISVQYKLLPLIITLLGILIPALIICFPNTENQPKSIYASQTNITMWYLSPLSTQNILKIPMKFSHQTLKIIDHGWVESTSAQGILIMSASISKTLQLSQHNYITSFTLITFIVILLINTIYTSNLNKV